MKKEKLELITTHLKETRAEALRNMTVTGQRLLQEPQAVSDDDDDDEGDDTVLGETRSEESESEESENEESESEEGDGVSLSHSQRDLVAQEVGVMHQVVHTLVLYQHFVQDLTSY